MKVGIIGAGWVGKAMDGLFGNNAVVYDPLITDIDHPLYYKVAFTSRDDINRCPITFVAVPTNALPDGTLDTSIVEDVVAWCESPLIVIRSTVNPGTCDYLSAKYKKRLVFQPEYLGETNSHIFADMKTRPFVVLGGNDKDTQEVVDLYTTVYNANIDITLLSLFEAEYVKLSENRAIAFKVMQCHELYKDCKNKGLNYYRIRDAVYGADPRFDLWFSFIYKDDDGLEKLGFDSSKCLKKDVPAWIASAEKSGTNTDITKKLVMKSREWMNQYKVDSEMVELDKAKLTVSYFVESQTF